MTGSNEGGQQGEPIDPELVRRLEEELEKNDEALADIGAKATDSKIEFLQGKDVPTVDIIAHIGGTAEVERKVGSEKAQELENQAIEEESNNQGENNG